MLNSLLAVLVLPPHCLLTLCYVFWGDSTIVFASRQNILKG